MNRLSPIAVNDGNPNSATAAFASATFYDFGSQNDSPVQGTKSGSNTLGLAFDESSFRAAGFNGQVYQIPIVGNFKLTDCMLVSTYFTVGAEVGYHFVLREADKAIDLGYLKLCLYSDVGNKSYSSARIQIGSTPKIAETNCEVAAH